MTGDETIPVVKRDTETWNINRDGSALVKCDYCGAKPYHSCVTLSYGEECSPHDARVYALMAHMRVRSTKAYKYGRKLLAMLEGDK